MIVELGDPGDIGFAHRAHGSSLCRPLGVASAEVNPPLWHAGDKAEFVIEVLDAEEHGDVVVGAAHQLDRGLHHPARKSLVAIGWIGADASDAAD